MIYTYGKETIKATYQNTITRWTNNLYVLCTMDFDKSMVNATT